MVKGLERRAAPETNEQRSLRALGEIKPVSLPRGAGPASSPRLPRVNVQDTVMSRIANNFSQYALGELGGAVEVQQQKSMMEGQMAAQQGKTFEQVEMGGDKWALEGYRLVEAQRMSSSLLTAQQAEIDQGLYEADPDAYRAKFMQRAEGVLGSASDQRVAELARDQLMKQMPVLVDNHMTKHLQWKEQRNFDALAQSVDTISMDPTSADTLLSFARGGAGSATAGLSDDRRKEAVAAGIVQAFENDNPQAYAVLASAGLVKDLPIAAQRSIRAARNGFEARARKQYNAEFITQERELMKRVQTGQLEPQQAMDLYADLMATHNMTITAVEAGGMYDAATAGVRGRKINTAMATQEAVLRGDRDTAVRMIRKSLSGTESGGNTAAFRTNKDGRTMGGRLQFSAARLADYAKATGTQAMTPAQYAKLSDADQAVIESWQVNDILDTIESKGLDKYIGQSINGVTVTYSGLVAVGHLGGKAGMAQFLKTGGSYNPSDELGTSLTDYLRKHGNGVDVTPEQAMKDAAHRISVLRDIAAVSQYEDMQADLDAIDEAYKDPNSTIDTEQWRQLRQDVRDSFNVQKTMADAKFERDVMLEVQGAAEDVLDEKNALAAGAKLEQSLAKFDSVMTAYAKGQASQQDVAEAQKAMLAERAAVRAEYGIPLSAEAEIAQYRKQKTNLQEAMAKRVIFDQEQIEIDVAEVSGTLDELPAKLQKRALEAQRKTVQQEVTEIAKTNNLDAEQASAIYDEKMADYYVRSGVVDPMLERTMNGFLSAGLVNKSGEPNMAYIEAAEQYRLLMGKNPAVADKYVREENRPLLDTVMDLAGAGDIAGAVRTIGIRQTQAPRTQSTADFMADPATVRGIDRAVTDYLNREEIGVAQAVTSASADLQQVGDRSWFDQFGVQDDANRTVLTDRIAKAVADAYSREPLAKPSELVASATRRVVERTPIIGGIAVPLPANGPSAGELFFGARAGDLSDQDGAIQDAVMDHFRSAEFRAQYGFVDDTTFQEGLPVWLPDEIRLPFGASVPVRGGAGTPEQQAQTLWTGVRPFQTYWDNASKSLVVQFTLPSGGYSAPIALDARKIGQNYIKQRTANAAD